MPIAIPIEPRLEVENPSIVSKKPSEAEAWSKTSVTPPVSLTAAVDIHAIEISSKILHIIDRYRMKRSADAPVQADEGALKFLSIIYRHVKANNAVPMCLPAFPFKSPNSRKKVLGNLPDRAEELALSHLNGLCQAIEDVYPPGAKLTIISDGLVYNDLLGVPDRDVWNYGETLRKIAKVKGLSNITFSRLRDLVSITLPDELDEMTYVANASNFRRLLLNTHSRPDWDWETVSKNPDVCLTYCGYLKFIGTDLEDVYPLNDDRSKSKFKKGVKYIVQQMMARGDAFANAVQQTYKDHVRLSIHPSTGANKLSISLLPTSSIYTTPWHCSIGYKLDGSVISALRSDFESDESMELIYENGRPSYYREKSSLFDWGLAKGGIIAEPIYPSGWLIRPAGRGNSFNMDDIDANKVRGLAEIASPVVLRGFVKSPNQKVFTQKSYEFGEPTGWKFGLVLEVKDKGSESGGLNNVLSSEWMPFHFDGLFKTITKTNNAGEETTVPKPPRFQFFMGATASPKDTGFTLFSSSTMIFKHLPPWLPQEALSSRTWSVSTSSFNQTKMTGLPLVESHPTTGAPCLRYHEPWPQTKTQFDATSVTIDGHNEADSAQICETIDEVLHDRRVCYYHTWEKGDLVVSDNILTMHTRSDFRSGSDRELWRIHFD